MAKFDMVTRKASSEAAPGGGRTGTVLVGFKGPKEDQDRFKAKLEECRRAGHTILASLTQTQVLNVHQARRYAMRLILAASHESEPDYTHARSESHAGDRTGCSAGAAAGGSGSGKRFAEPAFERLYEPTGGMHSGNHRLLTRVMMVLPALQEVFAPQANTPCGQAALSGRCLSAVCKEKEESQPLPLASASKSVAAAALQAALSVQKSAPRVSPELHDAAIDASIGNRLADLAASAKAQCDRDGTASALQGLNQEQLALVGMTLQPRPLVSVLFGPPGTGKTTTVSALLSHRLASPDKPRMLIIGQTNFAVEQMLTKTITRLSRAGLLRDESIQGLVYRAVARSRSPQAAAQQGGNNQAAVLQQVCRAGLFDPEEMGSARMRLWTPPARGCSEPCTQQRIQTQWRARAWITTTSSWMKRARCGRRSCCPSC